LQGNGLVKSIRFRDFRYLGDPINAVKLFNDLAADELAFMDIRANSENRSISVDLVRRVGEEANMPFSVGGGIRSISEIKHLLAAGAEKIILNTVAAENPSFVKEASEEYGSSTIVVSVDVKKNLFGKEFTYIYSGKKASGYEPVVFVQLMEEMGAGEIIINSIERDGMMNGYDITLISKISKAVSIPVVAFGGAGNFADMKRAVSEGFASAVAAGSMFLYQGKRRGFLINYPDPLEVQGMFLPR